MFLNGNELVGVDRTARGKLSAASFPAGLREGKHKVRWAALFDTHAFLDSEAGGAEGVIRFGYPAGGQSCLAFRLKSSPTGAPSGRFRVIGGSGAAKALRGSGAGTGAPTEDSLELSGSLRLREGRVWPRLGKACAPLKPFF